MKRPGSVREFMKVLSYDIGPRPPGSKAMRQAQSFLAEMLSDFGAGGVHIEPVPVFAWRQAPSKVEMLSPCRKTFESFHYVHSAAGKVSAEILDAGSAEEEEVDRLGQRIRGTIPIIYGYQISGTKYIPLLRRLRRVVERGAVGVVVRNRDKIGCPAIDLAGISEDIPIPVVGISYEAGRELVSSGGQIPRVRIETGGRSYTLECGNLVAELGSARDTVEEIFLSAHLDTFYINPGAFDNLTGVVTLMEMVRALAPMQDQFRRRLRLCFFTGEEYGFVGSRSYVRRNAGHLNSLRFVFNLDALFPATARGVAVMWAPRMRNYINRFFTRTPYRVKVQNLFCMSSDYLAFILAGIPAARPAHLDISSYPPWSHTRLDTLERIAPDWIRKNARVFAPLILRMLTDPRPLPVRRKSSAEVITLLEQEDVLDTMRLYGFDI